MQKEDRQFVRVLNPENLDVVSEYRTVFYGGEATFALAKLYGVTKEEKYLEATEKAMYLSNPSKYVNTFCIIKSNYRIRIDDIQLWSDLKF
mgnify:CR=1 FL=1